MKLLFLPKLLPRADIIGGPILVFHRIKNLSLRGHEITLVAPCYTEEDRKDKSLDPYCRKYCIDSHKERPDEELKELTRKFGRPEIFFKGDGAYSPEIERKIQELLEENFDAVIAEYTVMGQYIEANRERIKKNTLTVISVHEVYTRAFEIRARKGESIQQETIDGIREYEFRMYRSVDLVLTLTREDKEIIAEYDPALKDKIEVVPHGVDTTFYCPPEGRPPDRKNILYVGNFLHYPNVDAVNNFINKCWKRILSAVPDARFYAIGHSPPPELLALRNDQITIQDGGDNQNMRRFYWNSDIFVAPIELGTGFRGKILEAMATGLPVVATSLAAAGIDARLGKDMFITDNYETFSRFVIALLRDIDMRRRVSANAIRLAERFDHRRAAEKLEKVIKNRIASLKTQS